jgi:hydroxymethylbilane synthase
VVQTFNHLPTMMSIIAERAFLRCLGGGCSLPVGALASVKGQELVLRVQIVSPDGSKEVHRSVTGNAAQADQIGADLARALLASEGPWLKTALKQGS